MAIRCSRLGTVVTAGLLTWSGISFAAAVSSAHRVRLTYQSSRDCPGPEALLAQVEQRINVRWAADESEPVQSIRVVLEPCGAKFVGRMEHVDDSGRLVTRSIDAVDCEQALAGISLVTAIAIEAQATQPKQPDVSARPQPEATPPRPGTVEPMAPVDEPARSPSSRVSQEAGAFGGAMVGMGPHTAWGGGLEWGIGRSPYSRLKIAASWYEYRRAYESWLNARFVVASVAPQICGYAPWPAISELTVGLCAALELGQYFVKGSGGSVRHHWSSAQLMLPFRLSGGGLFVELQPTVRLPLIRGSFELRNSPRSTLEIPWVVTGANLSLGLTIR